MSARESESESEPEETETGGALYRFERECRTPYSEAYTILQNDRLVGRVDLHFTGTVVQGTLALAESLYGGEQNVITINMSEFQEAHTVSTLKGAPPGYVGYGEGGRLTEAVRRKPYSVVLLDEVEKAHPDVHELFFQVFDKGIMEDGNGRPINFKNTLILLTSNVGTDLIMGMAEDEEMKPDAEAMAEGLALILRD